MIKCDWGDVSKGDDERAFEENAFEEIWKEGLQDTKSVGFISLKNIRATKLTCFRIAHFGSDGV